MNTKTVPADIRPMLNALPVRPEAAEGKREPHQDETREAQNVEAGDDFRGEHCARTLPRFRDECPARTAIRALPTRRTGCGSIKRR